MQEERIGVVGAGMMGSEIALVFALAGHDVLLEDRGRSELEEAFAGLQATLEKGVERRLWDEAGRDRALAALRPTDDIAAMADRDIVIEAVFEGEAVKAETFQKLDEICADECIFASNTSTLSISMLAAHVSEARRRRFLGTHFFSPVSRMKLVEVIPGFDTEAEVVDTIMDLCRRVGKEPVRIKDVTGFAVNRLLHAFWIEAVRLIEEGVASPADIDTACRLGLGHPVGPFELMDQVTNGLSLQVQEILHDAYGPRFMPRPLMRQMVRAGRDGRKAGQGWHAYPDAKAKDKDEDKSG